MKPGQASGRAIRITAVRGEAPSVRAARSVRCGMPSSVAVRIRIISGSVPTICTRMTPSTVPARPKLKKISPRLTATTMPGTIIGASTKISTARLSRNGNCASAQAVGKASTPVSDRDDDRNEEAQQRRRQDLPVRQHLAPGRNREGRAE